MILVLSLVEIWIPIQEKAQDTENYINTAFFQMPVKRKNHMEEES